MNTRHQVNKNGKLLYLSLLSYAELGRDPSDIELTQNTTGLQTLTHFEQAAVVIFQDRLMQLDQLTRVVAIPGSVADSVHREALAEAARDLGGLDAVVNNAGILGPSPQPELFDYPLDTLSEVYRINTIAPLGVLQAVRDQLKPGARVLNITSDAGVNAYEVGVGTVRVRRP